MNTELLLPLHFPSVPLLPHHPGDKLPGNIRSITKNVPIIFIIPTKNIKLYSISLLPVSPITYILPFWNVSHQMNNFLPCYYPRDVVVKIKYHNTQYMLKIVFRFMHINDT